MSKDKVSFAAAVWKEFGENIAEAVSQYIDENAIYRDTGFLNVREKNKVVLDGLHLLRVIAYDAPGTRVEFDVIVATKVEHHSVSCKHRDDDDFEKWLRVSCEVDLDGGFSNFAVMAIEVYDSRKVSV